MVGPRVLLLDIETSPNIVYTWGKYEQNAIKRIKPWELLSFAWKELGKGKAQSISRVTKRAYHDEKAFAWELWKIIDGADAVITQNGDRFDLPKLWAKFVRYGFPPVKPSKAIDLKKIAKSKFAFYSNSLNDIAEELGVGRKLKHGDFEDLWEECMKGIVIAGKINRAAWSEMERYNRHDVNPLLEGCYEKVAPWHPTHPNLALLDITGTITDCPVCGTDKVQRRGYQSMRTRRAARLHCQNPKCGHWFSRALSNVA